MKALSVLIPYRSRISALRVLSKCLEGVNLSAIDFHLISLGDNTPEIRVLCAAAGMHFHFLEDAEVFSIGKALNHGAAVATGEYILKQDVDCVPYKGLYERILAHLNNLRRQRNEWANIGVFYCSKEFTEQYLSDAVSQATYVLVKNNEANRDAIKIACGNCFLVNRHHYLNIGGCSALFRGWGWEDYQLAYSLEVSVRPNLQLSAYQLETITAVCRDEIARPKNQITNHMDIVFLHRWHDPNSNSPDYYSFIDHNRSALLQLIQQDRAKRGI